MNKLESIHEITNLHHRSGGRLRLDRGDDLYLEPVAVEDRSRPWQGDGSKSQQARRDYRHGGDQHKMKRSDISR
ncbi:hypothetical protein [Brevundimonas sp.]|uniref:hypothetical protein n=1 Tax=Brevundimonas sp. TaxID=1871086 RepID=UPI0027310D41|nr:hypothetical protein [Brevundimonas sp.]MDP1913773.1 hypothetical protein [Brevundimonas sp.]